MTKTGKRLEIEMSTTSNSRVFDAEDSRAGMRARENELDATAIRQREGARDFTVRRIVYRPVSLVAWNASSLRMADRRRRYRTAGATRCWTQAQDEFLRNAWNQFSGEELADRLGRDLRSIERRCRRLGFGPYADNEMTVRDLVRLTGIPARDWRDVIGRGWLHLHQRKRCVVAGSTARVTPDHVRSLFKRHPEIFDYRSVGREARARLDLDSLPDAPKYKRVVCRSVMPDPEPSALRGSSLDRSADRSHEDVWVQSKRSCERSGGTVFWAPIYAAPICPRCGGSVSRFAPDGVFTDIEPGDRDPLDSIAEGLGIHWSSGRLCDAEGRVIREGTALFHLIAPVAASPLPLASRWSGTLSPQRIEPEG